MILFRKEDNFIFVQKPDGISTHTPVPGGVGFLEYVSLRLGLPLFPVHRLDKDTNGALIFCTDKETTKELSLKFERQEVEKEYLLVTDRKVVIKGNQEKLIAASHIVKKDGNFIFDKSKEPNAVTEFEIINQYKNYTLLNAYPKTGKPHQIRIHAAQLGFPILGDTEHGGTPFVRLMLHAEQIKFLFKEKVFLHQAKAPDFFQALDKLEDSSKVVVANEISKRRAILDLNNAADKVAFRVIHDKELLGFKCDYYGGRLWIYWYKESLPTKKDYQLFEQISEELATKEFHISYMINKGGDTDLKQASSNYSSSNWSCTENRVLYLLKNSQGASPGLFIDQRENRTWIKQNAKDKRVLNLFCYSGGFSVAAAMGGAALVDSVDTSSAALELTKENFRLNNIDINDGAESLSKFNRFRFYAQDAREFLKRAAKKEIVYDIIICDPPSFARSKLGVFSLEKELEELLFACLSCLDKKNGVLLFSTNFEKLTEKELLKRAQAVVNEFSSKAGSAGQGYRIKAVVPDLDCGFPMEQSRLKGVIVTSSSQNMI